MEDLKLLTNPDRFWSKADKGVACWLWTAAKDPKGYGRFRRAKGSIVFAHRLAYELVRGPIPPGMEVDHLCFTPACVRPDHLRLIEPAAHRQQGGDRAREYHARRTHCAKGHPFDVVSSGRRRCSICRREVWMKNNAKRRGRSEVVPS